MAFTKNEKEAIVEIIWKQLFGWLIEGSKYDKERLMSQMMVADSFLKNQLGIMTLDEIRKIIEKGGVIEETPVQILFKMSQDKKRVVLKILHDIVYIDDRVNDVQVNVLKFTESYFSGNRKHYD